MFNGVKTTEFWVTILTGVAIILTQATSLNLVPGSLSQIAIAVAAGLYAVARGIKKGGPGTDGP